jgi:hypothetical protein
VDTTTNEPEDAYHLYIDREEAAASTSALRLLISDEAHEPHIRQLAREVLVLLEGEPDEHGRLTVPLSPQQMKITHSAVKLLRDDLQRHQASERDVLTRVVEKLPDEHTMRAIKVE